jgi:thioredoxin 2
MNSWSVAMSDPVHVVCPHCDAVNRVPAARLGDGARCGKCQERLFTGQPVALDEARFARHVGDSGLPVVVDFWAPWCGPCQMMAPAFAEAARRLEPRARLVKINTDEAQGVATRYGIRSIPTLILFRDGQEADRVSGAMDPRRLVAWVQPYL